MIPIDCKITNFPYTCKAVCLSSVQNLQKGIVAMHVDFFALKFRRCILILLSSEYTMSFLQICQILWRDFSIDNINQISS